MNKNIKYETYFFYKDNKIYDINNNILPSTHYIFSILKVYKIPKHLKNIRIIDNKTIDDANNNLVFFGEDKNGKIQYFYGVNFIKNRKNNKFKKFIIVWNNIDDIKTRVINILKESLKESRIDKNFLISSIFLLELVTFIRLGKESSYKKNGTFGIRNILKSHIEVYDNYIDINFIGKKYVNYNYIINKNDNELLYKILKFLKFQKNNSDYLFSNEEIEILSEYNINQFLKINSVTFKDLRLYGVNYLFFKNLFNYIKENNNEYIKVEKLINDSIKKTIDVIQHTKSVSKNSYLIELEISIIKDNLIKIQKIENLEEFINFIIKELNNKN